MRILVTNDDGVGSAGLWQLAGALRAVGEVAVVAPNRDMSGSSAAMMLRTPLRAERTILPDDLGELPAFAVNGPPAACVLMGLRSGLLPAGFDLVVSGINSGANLGRDTLLSGTIGAAVMANLEGLPAIAVSVPNTPQMRFDTAAMVAARLAERVMAVEWRRPPLLNLNVPNLGLEELKGVRQTTLSEDCCLRRMEVRPHEGEPGAYRLATTHQVPTTEGEDESSDQFAVASGYVSISYLLPEAALSLPQDLPAEVLSLLG